MRRPPPLTQFARFPTVGGTALLSIGTSIAWWAQVDISPMLETLDVRRGQVWRLITAALPHLDFLHLAFNVYWLWVFGSLVEENFGHLKTLGIIAALALGSSAMEFGFLDGGVGLSGVVYGLFAMVLVLSRHDSGFRDAVDRQTITLFVVWFFICIYTTISGVMPVANVAHGAGAAFGALLGWAICGPRYRALGTLLFGVLILVGLAGSTFARPYINRSKSAAWEEASAGYDALTRGQDAEALRHYVDATRMNPTEADYWMNLGIAYHRLGRISEATKAYERAHALDPNDAEIRKAYEDTR